VLSVRALVAYLNAAVPPDRWEDFDDGEVRSALGEGADVEGEVRIGVVKDGDEGVVRAVMDTSK
jgi:hypothetical protein